MLASLTAFNPYKIFNIYAWISLEQGQKSESFSEVRTHYISKGL